MNVASLELCKELYELSGWELPIQFCETCYGQGVLYDTNPANPDGEPLPAQCRECEGGTYKGYDLGYLLRKLPRYIDKTRLTIQPTNEKQWCASYDYETGLSTRDCFADSPEDALALLAIELFNQGILTPTNRTEEI